MHFRRTNDLPAYWQEKLTLIRPTVGLYSDVMEQTTAVLQRLHALDDDGPLLITIDGPCGGGKSTLASALSEVLDAPVVHLDHFSIPHQCKTPKRLAVPGGNLDIERFCSEFLTPWLMDGHGAYRPYDCHADAYDEALLIPASRFTIIEGSYANLPPIARHASLRVFLRITPELQQERLLARVGPERLTQFNARWIPLERAYFDAYALPDDGCLCLDAVR